MEFGYHQTYRSPAAALALLVHTLFFALLYFGFSWRSQPVQGVTVELWDALPSHAQEPEAAAPSPPPPTPELPKPQPVRKETAPTKPVNTPPKADIQLKDKKVEMKKLEPPKPEVKKQPAPDKLAELLAEQAARESQLRQQAEQASKRTAEEGAINGLKSEYGDKIRAKIKRNVVQPPDVPDAAKAEFDVVLLPGGSVLNVRLTKSSGHAAYDSAVERAIQKAQPLPLPPDVGMFKYFRELHLCFSPVERVGEKCGS
jgi:colicin import membrane protein